MLVILKILICHYKLFQKISNEYMQCLKKKFDSFVLKYGHLRPSMYSILSKNYAENHKNYFSQDVNLHKKKLLKISI